MRAVRPTDGDPKVLRQVLRGEARQPYDAPAARVFEVVTAPTLTGIPGLDLHESCRDQSKFPLLGIVETSSPVAFAFLLGVSFKSNPTSEPALPAWSSALGTISLRVTNPPPNARVPYVAIAHSADGVLVDPHREQLYMATGKSFTTYPGFADALQGEALVDNTTAV